MLHEFIGYYVLLRIDFHFVCLFLPCCCRALDANILARQESKPRRRAVSDETRHPLLGDAPTLNLMGGEVDSNESSWWSWWPFGGDQGMKTSIPQRLEPKTFLASERTFLAWLHMAITISAISCALLAFAATAPKKSDPMHKVSRNLVEIIALLLLPLAVFIVGYALIVFQWRNSQIAMKQAAYIDDRKGPLLLAGLVVGALSAIFIVSLVDFYDTFTRHEGPSPAPSPLPGINLAHWMVPHGSSTV